MKHSTSQTITSTGTGFEFFNEKSFLWKDFNINDSRLKKIFGYRNPPYFKKGFLIDDELIFSKHMFPGKVVKVSLEGI